jgi:hypothetical protein
MRALAFVGTLLGAASPFLPLGAQQPALSGAVGAAIARLHTAPGTTAGVLSGPAFAAEGRVGLGGGRLELGVDYVGGRLRGNGVPSRDLVEGRVFAGVKPWPWLAVSLGPHVRAYVTDAATERWVFWQARARAQAPLADPSLGTYVEVWRALSSTINQGGEAGLLFRPGRSAMWARLSYRVDAVTLRGGGGGGGGETLEAITVTVGMGGR